MSEHTIEVKFERMKARSATAQWTHDHPHDKPCPTDPKAAAAWRHARAIGANVSYERRAKRAQYDKVMREKREREGRGA